MAFTLQQLSDLEEIRQLKHKYFRCIDTGNEAELAEVFADDVSIDLRGGGYRLQVSGKENMINFIASSFAFTKASTGFPPAGTASLRGASKAQCFA